MELRKDRYGQSDFVSPNTADEMDQLRGSIADQDAIGLDPPLRRERVLEPDSVGVRIVDDLVERGDNRVENPGRRTEWIDAGAEVQNLAPITTEFSCSLEEPPAVRYMHIASTITSRVLDT